MALHVAAMDRGLPYLTLKPTVCWQVPIRREDSDPDDEGHITTPPANGAGGTGARAARSFTGGAPIHQKPSSAPTRIPRLREELVEMSSERVYQKLDGIYGAPQRRLRHPQLRVNSH